MPPKKPAAASSGAKKTVAKKTSTEKPKETEKPTQKPEPVKLDKVEINLKQINSVVVEDPQNKFAEAKKWPLVIDHSERSVTFLRYQNVNMLNAVNPQDMQTETVRKAIIGSIRYGKPLVIDMMENNMYENLNNTMDEILPGLMEMIMDRSILQEENYLKLVRPEDGEEYEEGKFSPEFMANFRFIIVTSSKDNPHEVDWMRKMYIVVINA